MKLVEIGLYSPHPKFKRRRRSPYDHLVCVSFTTDCLNYANEFLGRDIERWSTFNATGLFLFDEPRQARQLSPIRILDARTLDWTSCSSTKESGARKAPQRSLHDTLYRKRVEHSYVSLPKIFEEDNFWTQKIF